MKLYTFNKPTTDDYKTSLRPNLICNCIVGATEYGIDENNLPDVIKTMALSELESEFAIDTTGLALDWEIIADDENLDNITYFLAVGETGSTNKIFIRIGLNDDESSLLRALANE